MRFSEGPPKVARASRYAPIRRRSSVLTGILVALTLAACQTTDLPFARFDEAPPAPMTVADGSPERAALNVQVLDAVLSYINEIYYDPRMGGRDWPALVARHRPGILAQTDEEGFYSALNVLLHELDDRHTAAMSPSARALKHGFDAGEPTVTFGFSALREGEEFVVVRVREQSPAAAAGVRIGWRVARVNGRAIGDALAIVPSETRTDALVFIDETGAEHVVSLRGVRIEPRPKRAAARRDDGVAVLRFDGFQSADREWLSGQMDALVADPPPALVVDLRDNPGGRLDILHDIIGDFIEPGTPFAVMKARLIDERYEAHGGPRTWRGPLAVLIGPGSGSAAELFAAAVQESGRGPVVGRPSAGAVIGARDLNLPDGGELSVSYATILTGKRALLEKVGVKPDIPVEPTLDDLRAGRDPALEAAVGAVISPPPA